MRDGDWCFCLHKIVMWAFTVIILICSLFAFNLLSADKKPRPVLIKGTLRQSLSSLLTWNTNFGSLYFLSFAPSLIASKLHTLESYPHQHEYVPKCISYHWTPPRSGLCPFLLKQPWWPLLCTEHGQLVTLMLPCFFFFCFFFSLSFSPFGTVLA